MRGEANRHVVAMFVQHQHVLLVGWSWKADHQIFLGGGSCAGSVCVCLGGGGEGRGGGGYMGGRYMHAVAMFLQHLHMMLKG